MHFGVNGMHAVAKRLDKMLVPKSIQYVPASIAWVCAVNRGIHVKSDAEWHSASDL